MPRYNNEQSESSNISKYVQYGIVAATAFTTAALISTGLVVPAIIGATVVGTGLLTYKTLVAGNNSSVRKKESSVVGIEPEVANSKEISSEQSAEVELGEIGVNLDDDIQEKKETSRKRAKSSKIFIDSYKPLDREPEIDSSRG